MDIKKIEVKDLHGLDSLYIEFTIDDTSENLSKYQFDLYKSNHQTDGFIMVASNIVDFSYRDFSVNLYDDHINYYYKVNVTNLETSKSVMSSLIGEYKAGEKDNYAEAIMHIHDVYLNNVINKDMILLKKKRFGEVCSCYDPIRRRSDSTFCDICYGAKYVGGYYGPYYIKSNFANASSYSERFSYSDVSEESSPIQFWTSNFPFIQIGDIIVHSNENVRYIVTSCQPSMKGFYLIRQTVQVQKLPKNNIVYKVQI